MAACGKKSVSDCSADANCALKSGVCTGGPKAEKDLTKSTVQALKDKCGALANAIPSDDCQFEYTEAGCKNVQNCEWSAPQNGQPEVNGAGTKCVQPQSKCALKRQSGGGGTDTMDAMIKSTCPNVGSTANLQQQCATKTSAEQIFSCFTEKCPIMGLLMGAGLCAGVSTQQACTALGDTCTYAGSCSVDTEGLLDKIIPKGCPLRAMFGGADNTVQIAKTCSEASTEGACAAAGAQCAFVTQKYCVSGSDEPRTFSTCAFNSGAAIAESMASFLGPVGVQMQKCSEAKTQTACEATPKGSVKPTLGTGTSISMDGALTIGVIVSLMIYS